MTELSADLRRGTRNKVRIGTRSSPLALWQAEHVAAGLRRYHPQLEVELVRITTTGDVILDRALSTAGGKGLFLKELEVALIDAKIDVAVHSMKDVTVTLPPGLEIAVALERADPRDAIICRADVTVDAQLNGLTEGARLGTSSLRRRCQLLHHRPDLQPVGMRGNVQTRLAKLENGECDVTVLAAAGLQRLGISSRATVMLDTDFSIPAVGQGIIGCETRSDDETMRAYLQPLHSVQSYQCLQAERAVNRVLDGGCHQPIAAYARYDADQLVLNALVGSIDGKEVVTAAGQGSPERAKELGQQVGDDLLANGAAAILVDGH